MWYRIFFKVNSVVIERNPEVDLILKHLAEGEQLPEFVNLDGLWIRPSSILAWQEEYTVNQKWKP